MATQATIVPTTTGNTIDVACVAKTNTQGHDVETQGRDISKVQCYYRQKYGHVSTQFTQKFCTSRKRKGHVLPECQRRPQSQTQKANLVTMDDSSYASDLVANTATLVSSTSSSASLTPEMVLQMIINAFTALRLSGKTKGSTWYLDSGASNHMTHSAQNLSSFKTQDVRET